MCGSDYLRRTDLPFRVVSVNGQAEMGASHGESKPKPMSSDSWLLAMGDHILHLKGSLNSADVNWH